MTIIEDLKARRGEIPLDAIVVLLSIPIIMTAFWYFGRTDFYIRHIQSHIPHDWPMARMYPFFYFSISSVVLRLFVPLTILFVMGRRIRDYGYRAPDLNHSTWGYVAIFAIVVPFIWLASTMDSFQARYPFGRAIISNNEIVLTEFLIYQAFYGLVFISGESFWRGFIVFGLRQSMGYLGILVMVIPYCMSHYGKPWPEAFASIVAGTVLGYLALRHRSFWWGVAVHWGAAITMDLLAIYQLGIMFK